MGELRGGQSAVHRHDDRTEARRGVRRDDEFRRVCRQDRDSIARLDPDGELIIHSSTQAPFGTRDSLAHLFGLSVERILGTLRQAGVPAPGSSGPMAAPSPTAMVSPGTSASWGQTGGGSRSSGVDDD